MRTLSIAGRSFQLKAFTLADTAKETMRDQSAAIFDLFLEREAEFGVHGSVTIDYPDLADTSEVATRPFEVVTIGARHLLDLGTWVVLDFLEQHTRRKQDMTQQNTAESAAATPLEEAHAKNVDATEEVKRAADELLIVRAVLEKVPEGTPPGDIELAAERAEALETDLSSAAEKLEEVNDTLAEELKARGASKG